MKPKVYKTKVDLKQILAATWYFPSKGLRGKRKIHIFSFTSSSLSSTIKKFNETPHLQWAGPHPSQEVSWGGSVVTLSMSGFPWLKLLVFIHFFFSTSKQFCAALQAEQRFCSKTFKVLPAPFMCIPWDKSCECAETSPRSCCNLNYFWTLIQWLLWC